MCDTMSMLLNHMEGTLMPKDVRHVLGISGGKDSAALAIYMRDRLPQVEYFFTDTGSELPEVYEYLDRLEDYLGKKIVRLGSDRPFDHLLKQYNSFLPSPNTRWCTREMKIKPFEDWIGDDQAITYVAIRADEDRDGYKSTRPNIVASFPFKSDGIVRSDVERILEQSGVGWPKYYEWRSRSGCYFCFFQRKSEWVSLAERHPDLFERAKAYEKVNASTGEVYTWSQGETLDELIARASDIKAAALGGRRSPRKPAAWQAQLGEIGGDDDQDEICLVCEL
jgi:3'-phosphoadenosine 5'-phosphosulfate sulfotransferase (PAPS reductase)/FAD synthetase